jgi:hypothetical protein
MQYIRSFYHISISFLLNFQPDTIPITTLSCLQLYKIGQRNYGCFIPQTVIDLASDTAHGVVVIGNIFQLSSAG